MYITRALIGRNPCLDQAIQTRKTIVLLLFYKTITLWFPCLDGLIQTLGNVARVKKCSIMKKILSNFVNQGVFLFQQTKNGLRTKFKSFNRILS
jgi:hypothetical protein